MPDQRAWRKSSYSGVNGGCVEVSLPHWHTSSYTHEEAACVEVSEGPVTGVRDSKNRDLGALFFPAVEWAAFVRAARQEQV